MSPKWTIHIICSKYLVVTSLFYNMFTRRPKMKVTCIVNVAYLCKSWEKEKLITEIEGRGTYSSGFTCVFPGMKEN